jgi:hypothetical protein
VFLSGEYIQLLLMGNKLALVRWLLSKPLPIPQFPWRRRPDRFGQYLCIGSSKAKGKDLWVGYLSRDSCEESTWKFTCALAESSSCWPDVPVSFPAVSWGHSQFQDAFITWSFPSSKLSPPGISAYTKITYLGNIMMPGKIPTWRFY